MNMQSDVLHEIPILKVEGKIEPECSPEFIKQVKILAGSNSDTIILDLHKTTFLDSAAIGIICSIHIDLNGKGKKLEIMTDSSPDGFINQLFDSRRPNHIIHFYPIERYRLKHF